MKCQNVFLHKRFIILESTEQVVGFGKRALVGATLLGMLSGLYGCPELFRGKTKEMEDKSPKIERVVKKSDLEERKDLGRIYFISNRKNKETYGLYSMNPDGSDIKPVKCDRDFDFAYSNMSASPDGRKLVLDAYVKEEGFYRLFVLDLVTRKIRKITEYEYSDLQPVWSPEGSEIAFSRQYGALSYDICAISPDGTDFRKLTDTPETKDSNPAWSPDGSRVAFVSETPPVDEADYKIENTIHTIGSDGKNLEKVLTIYSPILEVAWSPQGEELAYIAQSKGSHFDIFLKGLDGEGEPINRTNYGSQSDSHLSARSICWSCDGRFIFFASSRGAGHVEYEETPDGSRLNEKSWSDYDSDICRIKADGIGGIRNLTSNPLSIEREPVSIRQP